MERESIAMPAGRGEEHKTELLRELTQLATEKALDQLRQLALPNAKCFFLTDDVFKMVDLLSREVPPGQRHIPGLIPVRAR